MTTKGIFRYGLEYTYDDATNEAVFVAAPINYSDDFVGGGHTAGIPANGSPVAGYAWVKRLVKTGGSPAAAIVASAPGGVVQLSIDATSEKQEASLYQNDQKTWDSTKTLIYQARVGFPTLPSAAGVYAVWGLSSAWIDGPLNAAQYIEFGCNGSGELFMYSFDGTTTKAVDTGILLVANTYYQFRIEIDQLGVLHFFVNGTEYTTSLAPITWAATGTNAILQLYQSVYKASGVGVASMNIDSIEIWSPRT
jgi:hypothetical protein